LGCKRDCDGDINGVLLIDLPLGPLTFRGFLLCDLACGMNISYIVLRDKSFNINRDGA